MGRRILTEGLIAGFIGYVIVLVLVGLTDVLTGHPLFWTPAVLGSVIFFGATDPNAVTVAPAPVLAYNGVHLIAFLLFGCFLAWLASLAERGPQLWYVAVVIFFIVVPHVIGLPIWFGSATRTALSLWVVVGATSAAAVGMAAYLWYAHPRLRREMAADED